MILYMNTKKKRIDFIIDLETGGYPPDGVVFDIAVIPFVLDEDFDFQTLVERGLKIKLSSKTQDERLFDTGVMDWWKKQSPEAKQNLMPFEEGVTPDEAIDLLIEFMTNHNVEFWKSHVWTRGNYDMQFIVNMIRNKLNTRETFYKEPVFFGNCRDIRTGLEQVLLTRDACVAPLHKDVLQGFVKHDSLHDCAKDILMLNYARGYALGTKKVPDDEDIDDTTRFIEK